MSDDKPVITQAAAASLALAYHLYQTRFDARETKHRGEQLLRLQEETGVELVPAWRLRQTITRAKATLDRIADAVAAIDNPAPLPIEPLVSIVAG